MYGHMRIVVFVGAVAYFISACIHVCGLNTSMSVM